MNRGTMEEPRYLFPTTRYAFAQGTFWMSFCVIFAYASVYLLSKGYGNAQIGIIIAAAGGVSAILQPIVADYTDKHENLSIRYVIGAWSLLMVLFAVVLLLPGLRFLWIGLLYGGLVAGLQVITPLVNALGMECVNRRIPLNFGVARGIGSISYAGISYLTGVLVNQWGTGIIPALVVFLYGILLITTITFYFPESKNIPSGEQIQTEAGQIKREEAREKQQEVSFLKKYALFPLLLVGITFTFISHNIINNFMFQIMDSLGGGSGEMGTAIAIAAVVELPTMLGFSFLVRKISSGTLLKISGLFFFIKAGVMLAAPNVFGIYIAQFFQLLGFALEVPASVYYVNQIMGPQDRVKGQAFMTATNTLGSIAGSLLGGFILESMGVKAMLLLSCAAAGLGMGIIGCSIANRKKV